jgi:superfamily II DNA or RNA helicase
MILSNKGLSIPLNSIPDSILKEIKEELTVKPIVAANYDFGSVEAFPVYRINSTRIYLPKFYGLEKIETILPDLEKHNKKFSTDIVGRERQGLDVQHKFKGTIRHDQKDFINNLLKEINENGSCVGCAGTGTGKTVMSLYVLSMIKKKSLIIVHKDFLMNQWIDRIAQYIPGAKVGMIKQDKMDVHDKDIVIGMLQSISMKDYPIELFETFGFCILDECFEYNQLIITDKGPVKIGFLYELFNKKLPLPQVLSYNVSEEFEYKNITYAWENENENLLEIKYNNGSMKCTENHQILTLNGYLEANKLKVGDLIKCLENPPNYASLKSGTLKITSISKIKNIQQNNVYDLEIEDNHNFVLSNGPIVHNCHHIPSKTFSKALFKISCAKMLGLSATPNRKDGLSKILAWFLGPIINKDQLDTNIDIPHVTIIKAEYEEPIRPKYNFKHMIVLPDLINKIVADPVRNKQIVDVIVKHAEEGRQIVLLTARRDHTITIKTMLEKIESFSRTVGLYLGSMKKKDLDSSNECQIILGTFSMLSEAYDNPKLDTLILATSMSDIEQSVGRILRRKNANYPLIIDFVDTNLVGQGRKRKQFYRKKNFIFNSEEVVDDSEETNDPIEPADLFR